MCCICNNVCDAFSARVVVRERFSRGRLAIAMGYLNESAHNCFVCIYIRMNGVRVYVIENARTQTHSSQLTYFHFHIHYSVTH